VILGGGLAGLTLARQLRREAPDVRVLVAEKRPHPVREAAFKVGESSVEIGAHYFHTVLGLGAHLREGHLKKLGLRYFFPHGDNGDITRRAELGPRTFPVAPSFQLDRGRLENHLLASLREDGVEVLDGCSVGRVALGDPEHGVQLESPEGVREVRARWIADASGRAGILRRQLGLTRPVGHGAHACWFRVRARLRVDDWSADPAWRDRVPGRARWLSTNHLMGRGYWVWLIPLGSGSTSVGIVADGALHPYARLNRYERALDWLREFEPQCAAAVAAHADALEDFLALKHYAHGCARVFSPDRWALVGEAGVFTDPFYSPGSDFIAVGNDCAADLITRSARGEDVAARAEAFNETYLRLFDAFLRVYEGQYPLMGNAQVMTAKASWDNACYWGIVAPLYFQRRFRRPEFMASVEPLLRRFFVLHARMQQLLRDWDAADPRAYADSFTNVLGLPPLRELQSGLAAGPLDDDALRLTLDGNMALLERLASSWQGYAAGTGAIRPVYVADREPLDVSPLVLRPCAERGARPAIERRPPAAAPGGHVPAP
jgi:flavin-dependent dehydrogenase